MKGVLICILAISAISTAQRFHADRRRWWFASQLAALVAASLLLFDYMAEDSIKKNTGVFMQRGVVYSCKIADADLYKPWKICDKPMCEGG